MIFKVWSRHNLGVTIPNEQQVIDQAKRIAKGYTQ
jgi:hypothetical protein